MYIITTECHYSFGSDLSVLIVLQSMSAWSRTTGLHGGSGHCNTMWPTYGLGHMEHNGLVIWSMWWGLRETFWSFLAQVGGYFPGGPLLARPVGFPCIRSSLVTNSGWDSFCYLYP